MSSPNDEPPSSDEISPTSSVEIVFHDADYYGYERDSPPPPQTKDTTSTKTMRRFSEQLVRRSSSIREAIEPKTPTGWTVFLSTIASIITFYEIKLQTSLTGPPNVYGQITATTTTNNTNDDDHNNDAMVTKLYKRLHNSKTVQTPMSPSLFVGTRGAISSMASYILPGPQAIERKRQVLQLPDGAQVAIDWEFPVTSVTEAAAIQPPVILILHGINNHAGFGYVRKLMKQVTDMGWIAAGLNFRGCGGLHLTTPRCYNGAYTGDLRAVVHILSRRYKQIVLVGNSLGANLVAKYLGEEGELLPESVICGVTMGNPMKIDSRNTNKYVSPVIALGVKAGLLQACKDLQPMINGSDHYKACMRNAWRAWGLAEYDSAMAPIFQRNSSVYPFTSSGAGYKDAIEYWEEASSYKYVPHIAVPFLQLVAADDFLVHEAFRKKLHYNLCNPNVMVMQTMTGGHLGWHHGPNLTSWADRAVVDFVQAVMEEGPHRVTVRSKRSRL